ncbi:MAG: hypothetical protein [Microvirus sp.]|nr:MAG: hypothetical protein [Microvirus sp.]
MRRNRMNRHTASRNFNKSASRTKRLNVAPPPMRGGIRL